MNNKFFIAILVLLTFVISSKAQTTGTFIDARDGKVYKTVTIGTQTWMAENLAFKTERGCWAYNKDQKYVNDYGYLYDWKTAKQAAPSGWHTPTNEEWSVLINYLGGDAVAGDKLKEGGTEHWQVASSSATNGTNFNLLPGGYRDENGEFYQLGWYGNYWCSTTEDTDRGHFVLIFMNTKSADITYVNKKLGYSVRCIKD